MATSGSHKTEWTWLAIPGWLQFDWWIKSQSVEDNTSTIGYSVSFYLFGGVSTVNDRTLTITIDGWKMSTDVKLSGETGILEESEITISHNPNGTKSFSYSYELEWDIVGDWTPTRGGSSTGTLETINRKATISSITDFTETSNPIIYFSNPAGNSVETLQLAMKIGETVIGYRDITNKTSSSYTWELSDDDITAIYGTMSDDESSKAVTFVLTSIISGTTYYADNTALFTTIATEPTLSPTVKATDAKTLELTGDTSGKTLIRYLSDIEFNTGAQPFKGAAIKSQTITCGAKTVVIDGTSNIGTIQDITSNTFAFSVTDNRDRTAKTNLVIDDAHFVPYIKLTASVETKPLTTSGEFQFIVGGKWFNGSLGAEDNALTIKYLLRKNGRYVGVFSLDLDSQGTFTTDASGTYSYTYTITGLTAEEADGSYNTYSVQILINDKVASSFATEEKSSTAMPIFDWGSNDFNFNVPVHFSRGFTSDVGLKTSFLVRSLSLPQAGAYGFATLSEMGITSDNDIYSISGAISYNNRIYAIPSPSLGNNTGTEMIGDALKFWIEDDTVYITVGAAWGTASVRVVITYF